MIEKKDCLHDWITVYYGGFEVECSKCSISIYDVYDNNKCNTIIKELCKKK